jgi:hypothetical protein
MKAFKLIALLLVSTAALADDYGTDSYYEQDDYQGSGPVLGQPDTTYTTYGNRVIGSDGTTATHYGNSTVISDGRGPDVTCMTYGNQTICN